MRNGRPKGEEVKNKYSVRLTEYAYYRILTVGKGSFTKGILKILKAYFKDERGI